jgi:hypothetical protein
MFFIIKFFIIVLFLVAVFFVPLGSRPLSGHLSAIGSTPESQELKKEFLNNVLMLDAWMKSHQALSGQGVPPETARPALPDSTPVMRESQPAAPRVAPSPAAPKTGSRRPRKQGTGRPRGETP